MHYADYKTILSPDNIMNIYRGCSHGCIYCDSRSACYQIKHDFEDIEVKSNAAEILENQLKRRKKACMIISGSMCDPYVHLEEELQITRKCLNIINKYGFGIKILTKSNRILRDIDILKSINEKAKCVVGVTMTAYDEKICKKIEPAVSTTCERFKVLEAMRDAGIPTVVWISPLLPYITDTEDNLCGLLDYCIKAKVKGIICFGFGVTMREGNREHFYKQLDKLFPGIKQKYITAFGSSYECVSPNEKKLWATLKQKCEQHGIMYKLDDVYAYIKQFESNKKQISLFD